MTGGSARSVGVRPSGLLRERDRGADREAGPRAGGGVARARGV